MSSVYRSDYKKSATLESVSIALDAATITSNGSASKEIQRLFGLKSSGRLS